MRASDDTVCTKYGGGVSVCSAGVCATNLNDGSAVGFATGGGGGGAGCGGGCRECQACAAGACVADRSTDGALCGSSQRRRRSLLDCRRRRALLTCDERCAAGVCA